MHNIHTLWLSIDFVLFFFSVECVARKIFQYKYKKIKNTPVINIKKIVGTFKIFQYI